jgi:hypothetical protein
MHADMQAGGSPNPINACIGVNMSTNLLCGNKDVAAGCCILFNTLCGEYTLPIYICISKITSYNRW